MEDISPIMLVDLRYHLLVAAEESLELVVHGIHNMIIKLLQMLLEKKEDIHMAAADL